MALFTPDHPYDVSMVMVWTVPRRKQQGGDKSIILYFC